MIFIKIYDADDREIALLKYFHTNGGEYVIFETNRPFDAVYMGHRGYKTKSELLFRRFYSVNIDRETIVQYGDFLVPKYEKYFNKSEWRLIKNPKNENEILLLDGLGNVFDRGGCYEHEKIKDESLLFTFNGKEYRNSDNFDYMRSKTIYDMIVAKTGNWTDGVLFGGYVFYNDCKNSENRLNILNVKTGAVRIIA